MLKADHIRWTKESEKAYNEIKEILASPKIRILYDTAFMKQPMLAKHDLKLYFLINSRMSMKDSFRMPFVPSAQRSETTPS